MFYVNIIYLQGVYTNITVYGWVTSNNSGESFLCTDVSKVRVCTLLNVMGRDGKQNGMGGGIHVVPLQMEKGGGGGQNRFWGSFNMFACSCSHA